MSAAYGPAHYYAESRASSVSELPVSGMDYQMKTYPSQQSIDTRSYMSASRKSLYSNYTSYTTHTNMSYILPIVTNQPLLDRRPPDNWGLAFCSLFFNPVFGLFALLFAEQSKIYFTKCNYKKASQYGSYAKGAACGGIFTSIILLMWIIAMVIHHYQMFN